MIVKEIKELENLLKEIRRKVIEICIIDNIPDDIKLNLIEDYLKLSESIVELNDTIKDFLAGPESEGSND